MLEVDCRGLVCPAPIIELARHIALVAPGGLLGVVATDAAARADVPAWCRMTGHEFVAEEVAEDGAARYVVRRSTGRPA